MWEDVESATTDVVTSGDDMTSHLLKAGRKTQRLVWLISKQPLGVF